MTAFSDINLPQPNTVKIINANHQALEAMVFFGVINYELSSPPITPSSNGVYIPAFPSFGAWINLHNKILWYNPSGYWLSFEPFLNQKLTRLDNGILRYNGLTWDILDAPTISNQI